MALLLTFNFFNWKSLPKGVSKQEISLSQTLQGGVYLVSGTQGKQNVLHERLVVIREK